MSELKTISRSDGDYVAPVPENAPPAPDQHRTLGKPSVVRTYRDAAGAILFHVARFDRADGGEDILPLTLWRAGGKLKWRWKAPPDPRPLYGLPDLAARPGAAVLVVEGENTADVAAQHFPDLVVVTWQGGCKTVAQADWSPIHGRTVIIWPEADAPGHKAAGAVARAAGAVGAATVAVALAASPSDLPAGWDPADPWPQAFAWPQVFGWPKASAEIVEALGAKRKQENRKGEPEHDL